MWFAVLPVAAVLAGYLTGGSSARPLGPTFAPPAYVDQQLAGGEPEVFADTLHGTLIYSAHEGTTHLYRDGIVDSPWGDFSFVANRYQLKDRAAQIKMASEVAASIASAARKQP